MNTKIIDTVLNDLKNLKNEFINIQDFEMAAKVRDMERKCKEFNDDMTNYFETKKAILSAKKENKLTIYKWWSNQYGVSKIFDMKVNLMKKTNLTIDEINNMPFYEFEMLYDLLFD